MKIELRDRSMEDMAAMERLCLQARGWHRHVKGPGFWREGDRDVVANSYCFVVLLDGEIVGTVIARPRPETGPASVHIVTWQIDEALPDETCYRLQLLTHKKLVADYGAACEFRGEVGMDYGGLGYLRALPDCAIHEAGRDPVSHEVRTYQVFCCLGDVANMAFVEKELAG